MFTSDINKPGRSRQMRKTLFVYLAVALFCVAFDRAYALFGHGVFSASMTLMFLYPLLGGALPVFLLWLHPQSTSVPYFRLIYNAYNSGIAALTVRSALKGVFEIAGTSSGYLMYFKIFGWTAVVFGTVSFLVLHYAHRLMHLAAYNRSDDLLDERDDERAGKGIFPDRLRREER